MVASMSALVVSPAVSGCPKGSVRTPGQSPVGVDFQGALLRTGLRELVGVNVEVSGDEIVLSGTVGSYYLKQMAQAAVLDLRPAGRVRNQLQVRIIP